MKRGFKMKDFPKDLEKIEEKKIDIPQLLDPLKEGEKKVFIKESLSEKIRRLKKMSVPVSDNIIIDPNRPKMK